MKAAVWEAVHWDERRGFRQAEDVAFCRNAFQRGFNGSFCRAAIAVHDDAVYTQIGRQVIRRTPEGAALWALNALADLDPHELIARSICELKRRRVAEAVDCLRHATYKAPDCEEAKQILGSIESGSGGAIQSGQWRPQPII